MEGAWTRSRAAAGAVRVWLPRGEVLRDVDGIDVWSPDLDLGHFSVTAADSAEDGDALLAAERSGAEVVVEADERLERGGLRGRRLRYRSRRRVPRVVVERGGDRTDAGGEDVERLNDVLLLADGGRLIRVGYSVRTDAPAAMRQALAAVMDRTAVGAEEPP